MNRYLKGTLLIIISALIYGSMPIVAKTIYRHGVNSITLVFLRNSFCIIPLYLWVKRRGESVTLKREQIIPISFISIFGGILTPSLLFASYPYVASGTATTVHFIYPVFVLLGCTLFFKEPLDWVKGVCVILCTAGVFCFYTPGAEAEFLGLAFAFTSGITFAVYVVSLNHSVALKGISAIQLCLYMSSICASVMLVYLLATNGLALPNSLEGWLLCILFAFSVTLVATVCFQEGAFSVGSQRAAIFSTFEPIASIIIGIAVLRESFGWMTALGSALILGAVLLLTVWDMKGQKPQIKNKAITKET